jgi:hypothetical protein
MSEDKNKHPEEEHSATKRPVTWDGIKEFNKPLAALVAVDLLRHDRLGHRLHDRLPRLAADLGATPGILGFPPAPTWPRTSEFEA